ncbi:protein REVEILLE 5-like isoform X2 [Andrographis paniculata]|uniref:protein REVEILLE 5-like isoform X2 n=1 Tax=Andrographis paniculata TaxID=175694 RepID=UPI0021E84503|nr:protein REVEILLE 5-like isoform X2 [Andrographis paniculata]
MVSVHPTPPLDQDFSCFHGYWDPAKLPGIGEMKGFSNNLIGTTPAGNAIGFDDPNKKIRKPYTITKSRESWTDEEHDKFVEALHLFDRDWKKIEAFVGSKSVIQIRSHAQKYFLKVQKNGMSDHVPPPRPKRKASHPYPHKAPKSVVSQPLQPSTVLLDPEYAATQDSMSIPRNLTLGASFPWTYNAAPPACLTHVPTDDVGLVGVTNNYSSSSSNENERDPHLRSSNEKCHERKARRRDTARGLLVYCHLNFGEVYSFIGSVFDPCATADDHLQRLKRMDPVNVETAVLLMKNLAANLSEFRI